MFIYMLRINGVQANIIDELLSMPIIILNTCQSKEV